MGVRAATLPELFLAVENGMDLSSVNVDGRELILRSRTDSYPKNTVLAEAIADKLNVTTFTNPWIIKGLKIKQGQSPYSLEFITDDADVIAAPDFHHKNNGRKFLGIHDDYSINFNE